jgi:hypothetical protein
MEKRRLENYDRDMKRWEFMDNEDTDQGRRLNVMQNKYQLGRKGMGSAAFNILNANYEDNHRGNQLKERDDLRACRDQARSAHMEYAGGA